MTETTAPALEMLWESEDAAAVIASRFGFADAAAAGLWVAVTMEQNWGRHDVRCSRIVMSGHNALARVELPEGSFVLKWCVAPERFGRLAAVAELTAWLGGRGHPVSAPVATVDGRFQAELDGRVSVGLQHELAGGLLDAGDAAQVRSAGAVLARLHRALAEYPSGRDVVEAAAAPRALADRITGWLGSSRSGALSSSGQDVLEELVAASPSDSGATQLVHGDFRSANVLCRGDEVTAVLDFEELRSDFPVMELAQSAVMLGTRYRDWGPVAPEVHGWFLEGYQRERPLTASESAWWELLVLWFSLVLVPPGDDPTGWGAAAARLLETRVSGPS